MILVHLFQPLLSSLWKFIVIKLPSKNGSQKHLTVEILRRFPRKSDMMDFADMFEAPKPSTSQLENLVAQYTVRPMGIRHGGLAILHSAAFFCPGCTKAHAHSAACSLKRISQSAEIAKRLRHCQP